ncbi:MAG: DJ-1/PfpI family protein [Gammaproteobacteria bacterium]|nr:DJ-1/PfpI family protein [Gammaproteobacteria bacterium]
MASVLIPLAPGFEELEAVTVIDLLVRAGVEVITAGLEPGPVTASRGVTLLPDSVLDDLLEREFTMIVLPGGLPGADHLNRDPRIHTLLRRTAAAGGVTAAICAAPKVLAASGLLRDKRATAYPGILEPLAETEAIHLTSDAVVIDGSVITSRGPGTAMEFALTLIAKLVGEEKRAEVAAGLLYTNPSKS